MSVLAEQIMNAVLLGCCYTLAAVGFSLFFGVIDKVVFCVGDIAISGSFALLVLNGAVAALGLTGVLPFWALVLILVAGSALLCAALAVVSYRVAIKPYENSSTLIPLLTTIALGVVIRELVGLFYPQGRNPQPFPDLLPHGALFGLSILSYKNLIIISMTLGLLTLLYLFVTRTKLGRAMQAIAQNREAARTVGINLGTTISLTFVLGGLLLGIGGFLIGSYYSIVRFDMGSMYGVKGFSAAVVGGLGNTFGAIVGSMVIAF
ncbi:MAG TPA: branched-chain amino acid ABC transporter permease, partial [Symbiobacteriaceae bacterium]|nr:branched-chain amino acid ABC transporter permease [Symbiobacteriaceae bacterium]